MFDLQHPGRVVQCEYDAPLPNAQTERGHAGQVVHIRVASGRIRRDGGLPWCVVHPLRRFRRIQAKIVPVEKVIV